MRVGYELGGIPRDIHGKNFIIDSRNGRAVFVDIGERRIDIASLLADDGRSAMRLVSLLAGYYGTPDQSNDFVYQKIAEILPNAHILKSDNVDFAPIRRAKAQTVDIVAVIMPRRYSVFYLCRLIDKTGTQFNHRLLHQVAPIAKQIVKQHFPGPLLQDLDESFCAHVIYQPNSHKSNGVLILQNHFPTLKEIHMVGDWDLDILHGIEGVH